jgi:putative hydrolase of the HAD superfamily
MKVLLVDADGVVLKQNSEYFSERFAREQGIPLEIVSPFYRNEFQLCQRGERDIKEELLKYLPAWKWEKSPTEFLGLWLTSDVFLDEEIITKIKVVRSNGIQCFLVSNQEKYRAEYIKNKFEEQNVFDGYFFSCDLGTHKSSPVFFRKVLESLHIAPNEIRYFDNDQKNIDAASSLGIVAELYRGSEVFSGLY